LPPRSAAGCPKRARSSQGFRTAAGNQFDEEQSERVEDWEAACKRLRGGQLLWLALRDPSDEDAAQLMDVLELGDKLVPLLLEPPERASVVDDGQNLYVTLVAVAGKEDAPALVSVQCVLGPNWVVTAHRDEIAVLEEFRERAEAAAKSAPRCAIIRRGDHRVGGR
jgi:Mg2+ and Co2+ transporter CorA